MIRDGGRGVSSIDGLRERKKLQTRDAIRDSAHDLFVARGFAGTTVDDIAEAANVSPRTFFRYFANKEDVLFSQFDEALDLLQDFLASRPDDEPVEDSFRLASEQFASVGSGVSADPAGFAIFRSSEALNARYLQSFFRLESLIAEWLAARLGVPASDVIPRTLAAVIASGARVALDVWAEEPDLQLPALLQPSLAMVSGALAALTPA
jgi:AcrR family transcriptional regulator